MSRTGGRAPLTGRGQARYPDWMKFSRQIPFVQRLSGWLCLLALALWVALPGGVMLARDGGGALVFALCTGQGPILMAAGADDPAHHAHHHGKGADPTADKHPCPFASASAAAVMAPAETIALPVALARAEALALPRARAAAASFRYLRPESRGPPRLS